MSIVLPKKLYKMARGVGLRAIMRKLQRVEDTIVVAIISQVLDQCSSDSIKNERPESVQLN